MGWFTRSGPKTAKKEELWTICTNCKAHVFTEEWVAAMNVCPKCQFHDRITFKQRFDMLLDEGSFDELAANVSTSDPLNFTDGKNAYAEKAESTKAQLGMNESVVVGRGKLKGLPVVMGVMDFRFLGGSLGSGTGERILLGAEYALKHKMPYILFCASGGARMHEGIISLMQMAKTCAGVARLHENGIPYIPVLTHPTTGGVSASFAMVGDMNIAEPGVLIGFAGRRVIEETIKQKLPDDFQTAEYLQSHGFVDKIVPRKEMRDFLYNVLQYWNPQ